MTFRRLLALMLILLIALSCTMSVFALEGLQSDGVLLPAEDTDGASEASSEAEASSDGELEYQAMGYIQSDKQIDSLLESGAYVPLSGTLPSSYSLVAVNRVTSVKNQNPFGTCWAHAAIASSESNLLTKGQGTRDLSELQLVYYTFWRDSATANPGDISSATGDIVSHDGAYPLDFGGNDDMAVSSMANWLGLIPENELEYPGYNKYGSLSSCLNDANYLSVKNHTLSSSYAYSKDSVHLQNAYNINITDASVVKQMLIDMGAASLSYYQDNTYYNLSTYAYYQTAKHGTNHAVTLVGWDDNYSASNFKTSPGKNGAWLCKNSWGSNWGSNGYFWISYYDYSFIASGSFTPFVTFYDVDAANDYDYVYQYDGGLFSGSIGYNNASYCANVFTSERDEILEAVSFYTNNIDTDATIRIYTDVGSSPTSGNLMLTQTCTELYSGYHTISLDTPVDLPEGTKFSVVIGLSVDSGTAWLVYDYPAYSNLEYYSAAYNKGSSPCYCTLESYSSAVSGQSYESGNGIYWNAFKKYNSSTLANARIKAKTKEDNVSSVIGDVNNDQLVTVADAVQILRYIVGLRSLTSRNKLIADVCRETVDTQVNVNDVICLCRYIAGASGITSLPVSSLD